MLLIGAGGHARLIAEILDASGDRITAYVDPAPCSWLDVPHIVSDDNAREDRPGEAVLGIGGGDVDALSRRLAIMQAYEAAGWTVRNVIHPSAVCSPSAVIERGVLVMAGAVIQPGVVLDAGAIVNTGSIVEHDATVGAGAHIAPNATVLGGARIGACAMIEAGAVVLPGASVAAKQMVPAQGRHG